MKKLLKDEFPGYTAFENGFHIIRCCSDRFWASLSSDPAIESVLMKSLKATGGLTRGRRMSETQRLVWLLSMPITVEVNNAMEELTEVDYTTSEQTQRHVGFKNQMGHERYQDNSGIYGSQRSI